jgi:hypothetical protein
MLEARDVEHVRLDLDRVADGVRAHRVRTERLAQVRDVDLHHLARARRRRRAPQLLDQAIRRDDPPGVEQQQRQQRARLAAAQLGRRAVVAGLQRAEHQELHRRSDTTRC